jgi:hypothetical protein
LTKAEWCERRSGAGHCGNDRAGRNRGLLVRRGLFAAIDPGGCRDVRAIGIFEALSSVAIVVIGAAFLLASVR